MANGSVSTSQQGYALSTPRLTGGGHKAVEEPWEDLKCAAATCDFFLGARSHLHLSSTMCPTTSAIIFAFVVLPNVLDAAMSHQYTVTNRRYASDAPNDPEHLFQRSPVPPPTHHWYVCLLASPRCLFVPRIVLARYGPLSFMPTL